MVGSFLILFLLIAQPKEVYSLRSSIGASQLVQNTNDKSNLFDVLSTYRTHSYENSPKELRNTKVIRALVDKDSFDYYIEGGTEMGFQYSNVKKFIKYFNKNKPENKKIYLEIIPINKFSAFKILKQGKADLYISGVSKRLIELNKQLSSSAYEDSNHWVVSEKSSYLLWSVNNFIESCKSKRKKCFKPGLKSFYKKKFSKLKNGIRVISKYDSLIKKYAKQYGWDWKLFASLSYQESLFNQMAESHVGATGLFQVKPIVAKEPYIDIPEIKGKDNYENNIHAGVKYFNWVFHEFFENASMSLDDKVRFTLASYNAGIGRVNRARIKAKKLGYNPNLWFGNVEKVFEGIDLWEPVYYVRKINQRYLNYKSWYL